MYQICTRQENCSLYKMWGAEDLVVRMAGGPTNDQIKNSSRFKSVRENNMEMGGCSTAGATGCYT